ncbi:MAG: DUF202 domain-containing protein [Gammaproteobacteria bacterium]|nr:DUF202 domain-containing protein [Gammaproteobacteria bacterium]
MTDNEKTQAEKILEELETLALVRTEYSSERSLMSWMRTSASIFAFGFSIVTFFEYVEQLDKGTQISAGPRRMGLALILGGTIALILAVIEHIRRLRKMRELGLPDNSRFSLPVTVAVALLVIGIASFIAISFRL